MPGRDQLPIYGAGVTEVSCRVFSYFVDAERAGLCSTTALVEGLPITLAEASNPSRRASWDVWTVMCDRFAEAVGSDDAVIETSRFAVNEGFSSYLAPIAGLFVDAERLYEVAIRWGAPGLYRSVSFGFERQGDGLLISADLLPGFRGCRPWFLMLVGGMRIVPRFVGQPNSTTTVLELDDRHVKMLVTPSPWQRVSVMRRALAALRTPGAITAKLTGRQQQLSQAFQDMRRAEASFGNVLAALPMAVVVHAQNQVRWTNSAWIALAGDAVGKDVSSLFDSASIGNLRALRAGESTTLRLTATDGSQRILRASLVGGLEFHGEKVDLLCAADITAEHTARERLVRSQATIHGLLETQPELVLRFDSDLVLLDVIPGRDVPIGPALVAAVGRQIDDLIPLLPPGSQGGVVSVIAEIRKVLATGAAFEESLLLADADGRARRLHVRATPVEVGGPDAALPTSEQGQSAEEVIVVVRDETSRMDAEHRLAVIERLASLGTLASGVAHEINNPLTFLSLGLDELRNELQHVPAARRGVVDEVLRGLEEGARRIRDTVEHMRTMSRPAPQPDEFVDVKAAVERAVQATAQARRHVPVAVDVTTTRPAQMSGAALSHVLVHLLTRAASVVHDIGAGRTPRISVSARDDGDAIVVSISDTGAAIAPELLPRVLDPFAVGGQRAGMGLTIVHSIVRGVAGTINVKSGDQGTTFSVRLPARGVQKLNVPAVPTPTPARPQGRVVVIDDEPLVASSIARLLSRHEVQVFQDAQAGLQALMTAPVDVVICDVMMPGMSGVDLHGRVASEKPELLPRMLFVTGGVFTEQTDAFLKRPNVRALAKPFTPTAIRDEVERIM